MLGLDLFDSGKEAMSDFCENKNESLGPISHRKSRDSQGFIFMVFISFFLSDQYKKAGNVLCIAIKLQPTAHCCCCQLDCR